MGFVGSDFFYRSERRIHPIERVTSSVTSHPCSKTCPTTPRNIKSTKEENKKQNPRSAI